MAKTGVVRAITPFTKTVKAIGTTLAERFTPNWDKGYGAAQAMDRVAKRVKMGQKLTPRGAGVAVRNRS